MLHPLLRLVVSSAVLLPFAVPAHAQDADSQFWTMITVNKTWKNKIRAYAEIQPRIGTDYSRTSQLLIRASLGYQFTPTFSASLGHGWTPSFTPEFNTEDRWYGQLLWEDRLGAYQMINRTRLELRSIAGAGDTAVRLRHMTRFSRPVSDQSKWIGIFSNELLWNLNNTPRGPEGGFDQYRIFWGMGYNFSRQTRLELGYQATFLNLPRTPVDRRQDTLLMTMNFNL